MKRVILVLVLMLSVLAFSGNLVKAYTTLEEPLAKELFDLFEAQTGIKVEWVRLSTGETVARLEAERENPQASIWVGGVGLGHIEAKIKGLTTPYKSPLALRIPAGYRDPEFFWIGLYIGPLAFATNNNRAEELGIEPPKGWFDIIDSDYRNMVRVANPNTSGTAYNVITTIYHLFGDNEDLTFMYLHHLDRNVNMYTKSGSAGGKDCAIGETPIAIGYLHDLIRLQKNGAPITITIPEEGTGFEIASMSLIKGGKEPVEAKKLYNWILGKDAQEIIAKWYVIPLSPEAPKDKVEVPIETIRTVDQDFVWDAANRERLTDRWNNEIGR
ncbi:iron ABC transporter substrate-binding protein [Kosmotoga arenicorallina S304]|uniref:Iron ABC transporter substrate-binding protein n=1 Tax=Kosmotoga arenicorallina S304 TaxID=1453497 RepID=A0A176JSX7_9BACT|nr:ABC transporter substrate-binding protein [Kosmotoga arenicorallina]OAA26330.1 iron ABC transporter substrate-binding protein [Kosmotoga arenicorallina S304]